MASMTMTATASFLPGAAVAKHGLSSPRRGLIVAKASSGAAEPEKASVSIEVVNGRRDLVFAAAAAAVAATFTGVAMADDEEPKAGTAEARKKYAPVCITMPTARICHK